MKLSNRVKRYLLDFNEVKHTTFNPEGPGVVRIHLIPPNYSKNIEAVSVAIINGQDIIPINVSWTVLLSEFIDEVNIYGDREINKKDADLILKNLKKRVHKLYPLLPGKIIRNDIATIIDTFTAIAYNEGVPGNIGYLSLKEYAPFMNAPHRMDLMVSAMTKDGNWHCNQKCIHCYAAGQKNAEEKELSTDEWKTILDKCRQACIPQVTFTGGEPTMRQDLIELIDYAHWFVTRLNTNGIKLTSDFCQELYQASLDSVQITFYSSDPEIHNKLVGATQYDKTVEGIKNALGVGLSVSVNTPLCTLNSDYVKTLSFLHELGVKYVTCSGLITTGNALTENSTNLQLSKDEIREVVKAAVNFCYENEMEISFTSPGWIENEFFEEMGIMTPGCGACLSNMAITPGGNVVPCQSWLSGNTLGNMLNNSWEEIWNTDECRIRRDYSAQMLGECPLHVVKGGQNNA